MNRAYFQISLSKLSCLRKLGDSNPRYANRARQFSKLLVSATHPNFLGFVNLISTCFQMRCKGNTFISNFQTFCLLFSDKLAKMLKKTSTGPGQLGIPLGIRYPAEVEHGHFKKTPPPLMRVHTSILVAQKSVYFANVTFIVCSMATPSSSSTSLSVSVRMSLPFTMSTVVTAEKLG